MPYEHEFASYSPIRRIAESEKVRGLLSRAKIYRADSSDGISCEPIRKPRDTSPLPRFILAIDGSSTEVAVRNGYPGARVGYCTVASILIDLHLIEQIDAHRPVDPVLFRKTENASAIDAALPGCNVVTRRQTSAVSSFREELYDRFESIVVDDEDHVSLRTTFESLLSRKPDTRRQRCPYVFDGLNCSHEFARIPPGCSDCPSCGGTIYSTDALRIHERFSIDGSNGEAFGLVMQVWEKLLLIHLLRCFEGRGLLSRVNNLAFFLDGPLAVFGPPAWLSKAIGEELKRINSIARESGMSDILILGIEKAGTFVSHFDELDEKEDGQPRFRPGELCLLTDDYIKNRIQQSQSDKPYGVDTYFGRKFFYKTENGARIVATIPYLNAEQESLDKDDPAIYPRLASACRLLDKLVTARYPNALAPIVSAHAEAAIPLNLGAKVLQQLAKALVGESR